MHSALGNSRVMTRFATFAIIVVVLQIFNITYNGIFKEKVSYLRTQALGHNNHELPQEPKVKALMMEHGSNSFDDTSTKRPLDPCQEISLPRGGSLAPKKVKNTKVLVTGGAGFIGSNLVDRLLDLGYTVRILDNLYTGFLRNVPLDKEGVEFVLGDILDPVVLEEAMDGIDYVFHLAAMSKVVPSLKDPDMARFCVETNALGTWNVLNATRAVIDSGNGKGVKKVVYAASSTYYGNKPPPQQEDMAPDFLTPYAASKYEGELQMQMFDRLFQVPTISTRFFMVYGPRQPSTGAYAIVTGVFAKQAADGKPLTIEGDGSHYRDFIHVQDIVTGLILSQQHPKLHGDVVNLGTGTAFSVQDVADLVSSDQVHVDPRKNDLEGTLADTCRMKKLLGYNPSRDFKEEMTFMVKETLAGNVFMQDWLTPLHALAAPHLLAPGTPVFNWPKEQDDLDAILLALKNMEVEEEDAESEDNSLITVIPLLVDEEDDLHIVRSVLLNTVFSLVRFGAVTKYFVATSSKAALELCSSLNLPCYDAQKTTALELLSNLLTRGLDVHYAQIGNSYMRPVPSFFHKIVEGEDDADVYQAKPLGDIFVRNNEHVRETLVAWVEEGTDPSLPTTDLFSTRDWPKTLRSTLQISSFDVSTICEGSLTELGGTFKDTASPFSPWDNDDNEAGFCDEDRFYLGVACSGNPSVVAKVKTQLEKTKLWHLRDCVDKDHCDVQQLAPSRWVQKNPDLKMTGTLC